ncbi:unnamed protein product [Oppiella nova]|uniref:ABC-2 type transporter transmembrane domain-containing protein n=1 Tax=Oppiella nova TaxID=334625 RepID=A0A7R9QSF9_9ACAR|nr:unnamed protein product [Oppiella nova]CAG2173709.1 unnamed protein product [Oppiella nova]
MAKSIVQVLKTMALEGRTVICTIHQPSSQVFELFDSLLLMTDGRVAFKGSIGDAKNFFSSQGLQICDNYLDSSYSDITINANENNTRGTPTFNKPILRSGYRAGYWRQFVTLLWRSYITLTRNPKLLLDRLVMYLINAFLFGLMFYNIGHAYSDASNIMGVLIMVIYVHTVKGELRQYVYHHGNISPINTTNTTQLTTTYTSGVEVIESQGFDESALMWCPFALMAWALVYMFIAYIGLCRKVRRKQ